MGEFLSKVENFLFDILGLVLPGAIFIVICLSPVFFFNIQTLKPDEINSKFFLSVVWHFSKNVKGFLSLDTNTILWCFLIISYLIGHLVKVVSIIKYEVLVAVFDRNINIALNALYNKIVGLIKKLIKLIFKKQAVHVAITQHLKNLTSPIVSMFNKIFKFDPPAYFKENDSIKTEVINIINHRLSTNYPNKWYSVYKFSTAMHNQEGLKSLAGNFLAKYNLYRSLAAIFAFATIYLFILLKNYSLYLFADWKTIAFLIPTLSLILWFVFHYKYKRYWTLCGNESLISLYYFLNKKKINEP